MADAKTLEELATVEYWDARYSSTQETSYEWFKSFENLKPFLAKYLPAPAERSESPSPRALHLGCGNSVCAFVANMAYGGAIC